MEKIISTLSTMDIKGMYQTISQLPNFDEKDKLLADIEKLRTLQENLVKDFAN